MDHPLPPPPSLRKEKASIVFYVNNRMNDVNIIIVCENEKRSEQKSHMNIDWKHENVFHSTNFLNEKQIF